MLGTHMASFLAHRCCILLNCILESKTSITKYIRNKFKSFLSQEIVVNFLLLDLVFANAIYFEECVDKVLSRLESLARILEVIEFI